MQKLSVFFYSYYIGSSKLKYRPTIPNRENRGLEEGAGEEALTNGFIFANPTLAAPDPDLIFRLTIFLPSYIPRRVLH